MGHSGSILVSDPVIYEAVQDMEDAETQKYHKKVKDLISHAFHYSQGNQQYAKSLELYNEALEIQLNLLKLDAGTNINVASTRNDMGIVQCKMGNYEESIMCLWDALATKKTYYGDDHLKVAATLYNLAVCHACRREYEMAREIFDEALLITTKKLGNFHLDVSSILQQKGMVHFKLREEILAGACFRQALRIRKRHLGNMHLLIAETMRWLGNLEMLKGKKTEAIKYYKNALRISKQSEGLRKRAEVAMVLSCICQFYFSYEDRRDDAEQAGRDALYIFGTMTIPKEDLELIESKDRVDKILDQLQISINR
mmetsp:Transcript_15619/g.24288  ORF Transcript_15619/g.24288 Transcript_15619/m.24288 type:complete len:312 (+) Transcript_15619:94-1029(+)